MTTRPERVEGWSTVGQERVVAALQRDLASGRVAHAYLFTGPPQTGKATLARELAQALNCEAPLAERPCGRCGQCERIAAGKHADIETLTPHSPCEMSEHDHGREGAAALRICQIRRVEHALLRAPYEGRTRVIIVDPADALTPEAANAFLKTLEEPPPNCAIVLVAVQAERLPTTVASRCRTLPFRLAPMELLRRALVERWGAAEEEAERVARLAQGRPGWARAALLDEALVEERISLLRGVAALSSAPRNERLAYAASLVERWPEQRREVGEALDVWQAWWRDVLLVCAGRGDLVTHQENIEELGVESEKYGAAAIVEFIEAIRKTASRLEENANPRLALDVMMLALPRASSMRDATGTMLAREVTTI